MIMLREREADDKTEDHQAFLDEIQDVLKATRANAKTDIDRFMVDTLVELACDAMYAKAVDMDDVIDYRERRRLDNVKAYVEIGKIAAFDAKVDDYFEREVKRA